jgi:hypothetical protein
MATTPVLLAGVASTWTGFGTVDPLAGAQMVTDGAGLAAVHVPPVLLTVTVAFAVVEPPGPVAVRV